jgi:hypothetical protein
VITAATVDDDQAAGTHPRHRIQRRLGPLAVTAAVEHQQVERPVVEQLAPVAVAHPYPWIIADQLRDGGGTLRVALDADDARVRMAGAGEPRETNPAARPGLADRADTDAASQDPQQLALLGPARAVESHAAGQIHRRDHRRWLVAPRIVGRRPGCGHATNPLVRKDSSPVIRGPPSCRRCHHAANR